MGSEFVWIPRRWPSCGRLPGPRASAHRRSCGYGSWNSCRIHNCMWAYGPRAEVQDEIQPFVRTMRENDARERLSRKTATALWEKGGARRLGTSQPFQVREV